jgi:proteasome alpha subunit
MQPGQHQMMGYDRAITMFSPDGRLLQVEYAKKTVRLGNTAIGIVYKDGVLLVTDKRIVDKLVVASSIEKIFVIDDHIILTAAGILADARVLVERAQSKAQEHHITYESSIDTSLIVKDIANLKQLCTQSGGLRPFGVAMLIAGVDEKGPQLYQTDPTGSYYEFKASTIGEGENEVQEVLHKKYKDNMTFEQALTLAVEALKTYLGEQFTLERLDAAYVDSTTKIVKKLNQDDLKKVLK